MASKIDAALRDRIVEIVERDGMTTAPDIANELGLTPAQARAWLKALVKARRLVPHGGTITPYTLPPTE